MTEIHSLPPFSEWTPGHHAQCVRHFFSRCLEIDNEDAVNNLIAAGYDRMARLDESPPTHDDLDKVGFNMYQRNMLLKVLKYGATAWWLK